jgi:hypothetical protein
VKETPSVKLVSNAKVEVKRLLAKDPEMTAAQIAKKLPRKVEISEASISNVRSDFRQTLAVLQEAGELRTLKV